MRSKMFLWKSLAGGLSVAFATFALSGSAIAQNYRLTDQPATTAQKPTRIVQPPLARPLSSLQKTRVNDSSRRGAAVHTRLTDQPAYPTVSRINSVNPTVIPSSRRGVARASFQDTDPPFADEPFADEPFADPPGSQDDVDMPFAAEPFNPNPQDTQSTPAQQADEDPFEDENPFADQPQQTREPGNRIEPNASPARIEMPSTPAANIQPNAGSSSVGDSPAQPFAMPMIESHAPNQPMIYPPANQPTMDSRGYVPPPMYSPAPAVHSFSDGQTICPTPMTTPSPVMMTLPGSSTAQPQGMTSPRIISDGMEVDFMARINSLERQVRSLKVGQKGFCSPGGYYAGAAAIFAKPHFKEAFQHSRTNALTGQQTLVPFSYDYEFSPRGWFGYKGASGMGWRTTYWLFDHDGQSSNNMADGINIFGAHAVSIIFPANIFASAPGDTLVTSDSLSTEVVNAYGTYDTCVSGLNISAGAGLRYAKLEQRINAVVNSRRTGLNQLNWSREFEGIGPSLTLDLKKRLGSSPFSAFASGGGSLLFGTKTLQRSVTFDQSPNPSAPQLSLDDADEVVGIGEMNVGLELDASFSNGYCLTVRGLYEGQLWAEAGAPTLGFLGFEGFGIQVEVKR